ncbi:FtsX-like permease family protein [Nocardioides sp.]|uniref:FtsX-like permease family protein n=1 Tax=Nocardioides sp. TaxID=35761 RepID=UPI002ED84570
MNRLSAWRLALRVAAREALRAKGRSVLVIVMIALPVLAVTAADVLIRTQDVSGVESLDRRLGAASAQVSVPAEGRPMIQAFDPWDGSSTDGRKQDPPTAAEVSAVLGGARLVEQRAGGVDVRTESGVGWAEALEVDLADPVAAGLVDLTSGRLPGDAGEVVVNQALLDKGYAVGDRLELGGKDAPTPVIVGAAESATVRSTPAVAGPVGSLGLERDYAGASWLVAGGPVSWATVERLNALGAVVLSRAVVADPPPDSEIPEEIRAWSSGSDDGYVAAVVLIVVMALLEVVLLAGPAFAVSARRQARSLALMAVAGGTPAQARRVVLAGGLVLGGVAAVLGVALGIGLGWALVPVVQRWSTTWFGPFDVPWLHLLGIAGFGLVSAVLAAAVPAWIASRHDVVAVLAGRRADRPVSLRSPLLGVALLGAGVAGSAYGAHAQNGEFVIAGSAVVAVLGMISLVPLVVVGLSRVSGRLPLAMRYAARDAARHRTRTVPAVAAVAATVAGVVALGISVTSDEAENEATYSQQLPMGIAAVTDYRRHPDWDRLAVAVEREAPGVPVRRVTGTTGAVELTARRDGEPLELDVYGGPLASAILVDDGDGVARLPGVPAEDVTEATRALAAGGAVVFTTGASGAGDVQLAAVDYEGPGRPARVRVAAEALTIHVGDTAYGPRAVLSPEVAAGLGLRTDTVGLVFDAADLSDEITTDISEAVSAASPQAGFYVERGYQAREETVIIQLVLAGLGAVLMLGGTLTATFLALSDARPDLATLSAVGASPRRRRAIAAAYALVVGLVGAVLGAAVGFIPGIAITYPLTAPDYSDTGPFLDVPWLLVGGVVLALPLLTALVVGVSARSRLPLVSRLD